MLCMDICKRDKNKKKHKLTDLICVPVCTQQNKKLLQDDVIMDSITFGNGMRPAKIKYHQTILHQILPDQGIYDLNLLNFNLLTHMMNNMWTGEDTDIDDLINTACTMPNTLSLHMSVQKNLLPLFQK